jgi:Ribbon-helix-helix protein, copG family
MYHVDVKAVTITIPEELDRRAAQEARRRGISKSELIRQGLRAVLPATGEEITENPWVALAGFGPPDVVIEPGEIDEIVYGL